MARFTAERRGQERERALERGLRPDDPRAQGQDVHVVVLDALVRGIRVVADRRADAAHLVGGHARPDPGAADEDPALRRAALDRLAEALREVRVIVGRVRAVAPEVAELMAQPSGLEPADEVILEGGPGMVGGECDAHGPRIGPAIVRNAPPSRPTRRYIALVTHVPEPAQEHLANRDLDVAAVLPASPLPAQARVVIVGGGIIGASIAYHLAAAGETDVALVERGRLTNGTTWHAAGLVSQVRGSHALTALSRINAETYERVERETGIATGIRRNGALTMARTEARLTEIRYGISMARDAGVEVELVDRARIRELWPAAVTDDLVGGVFFPTDGTVNPGSAALALAKGAVDGGVRYVPGTAVTGLRRSADGRRVTGIEVDGPDGPASIEAEVVVLAAGLWTSELARQVGASVALYPAEHVWVMTEPTDAATPDAAVPARPRRLPLHPRLPRSIRRRRVRAERQADVARPTSRPAASPSSGRTGTTSRRSSPRLATACPRSSRPGSRTTCARSRASPPTRTSSSGSCPRSVACSWRPGSTPRASSSGRASAGRRQSGSSPGIRRWTSPRSMWRGSGGWANQRAGLPSGRSSRSAGCTRCTGRASSRIPARGLRRLPLDGAHRAAGAAMGQVGGWERPLWFEPGAAGGPEPEIGYDYAAPSWFPAVRDEVSATREGVALYDLTTYAKFLVEGPGALDGLQRLATSDLDVEPGRIVYTVLANERGGIELDPTITRLADDRFLVLAPTVTQRRCEGLLRNGLPGDAVVTDVTSGWATLHVAGPRSRDLLARLTDADLADRRLAVPAGPRDRRCAGACVGVPRLVHRGARLGAGRADRIRGRPP